MRKVFVDSTSPEDFNAHLENCKAIWNAQETPYAPSGPQIYTYFVHYKAHEVFYTMHKDVREVAGLGSSPGIFTVYSIGNKVARKNYL